MFGSAMGIDSVRAGSPPPFHSFLLSSTQAAVSNFNLQSKSPFGNISSSDLQKTGLRGGFEPSHFFSMDGPKKEASESDSPSGNNGGGFEMPVVSLIDGRERFAYGRQSIKIGFSTLD